MELKQKLLNPANMPTLMGVLVLFVAIISYAMVPEYTGLCRLTNNRGHVIEGECNQLALIRDGMYVNVSKLLEDSKTPKSSLCEINCSELYNQLPETDCDSCCEACPTTTLLTSTTTLPCPKCPECRSDCPVYVECPEYVVGVSNHQYMKLKTLVCADASPAYQSGCSHMKRQVFEILGLKR